METHSLLKKISLGLVSVLAIFSILLLVPITDSFVEHSKLYSLFFGTLVVLALFILKTFKEGAVRISVSPVSGSLALLSLATMASTFFTATYPVEGLLGLGGILLSTTTIALLGGSLLPKNSSDTFLKVLTGSSVALVVFSILQMIGFGPAQLINRVMGYSLPSSALFNLAGSPFIALQITGLTLLAIIVKVVSTKKLSKFFAVTLPILVIGAGMFAWNLLPGKVAELKLPSYASSWSIMLDTIRAPKSALIGAGVSSYGNVYQIFKPIWLNNTNDWAIGFNQAANMPITVMTTMGVLGLIAWTLVVLKFAKFHKNTLVGNKPMGVFVGATFLLNLILPFNTIMLTLQALGIACLVASEKHRLPLLQIQAFKFRMLNKLVTLNKQKKSLNVPLYLGTLLGFAGVVTLGYFTTRAYQAHMVMNQANKALAEENVVSGYELQQKAVNLNPYYDVFRRQYSSTSSLVAIALSNKADLSDAEKQQVSSLLQQSVTQARAATTLDGMESQNWINLAQVYSNLIGVSEDAINWTVQSYVSAIETNPNNPLLRLDLASVFAAQEEYQQALGIYDQAIALKPDLAISHFNRGLMLEKIENEDALREARLSYQRALVLLDANSEDYVAVTTRVEELEKFMEENNISLEAPETEETTQGTEPGDEAAMEKEEVTTPSIIEQNLNNSDALNSETEPVELNSVQDSETESVETTEETSETTP